MNPENNVSLDQLELKIRRSFDELNNIFSLLCKNIADLSKENEELKEDKTVKNSGTKQ